MFSMMPFVMDIVVASFLFSHSKQKNVVVREMRTRDCNDRKHKKLNMMEDEHKM